MRLAANVLLALALAGGRVALADGLATAAIDPGKSSAQFSIEHIFVERVTGSVPITGGSVALAPNSLVPVSVNAVLDATKIHTDEPDRDSSLESDDYFDVRRFPTWTFSSTKIVATGPATFSLDGVLTMHGVTQPEHLDVSIGGDAAHPKYHAVGRIDRHAFGMKGARLDPVIGNTADITLDIALK